MRKTGMGPNTGIEQPATSQPPSGEPRLSRGWRAFFAVAGIFMALYALFAALALGDYARRCFSVGEPQFVASAVLSCALVATSALCAASFLLTTRNTRSQMLRDLATCSVLAPVVFATLSSVEKIQMSRLYDGWEGLGVALGMVVLVYALAVVAVLAAVVLVKLAFALEGGQGKKELAWKCLVVAGLALLAAGAGWQLYDTLVIPLSGS